jgi:hypothetical protein
MTPSDRHRFVEREYAELLSREIGEGFDPAIVDTCVQMLQWKLIHRRSKHFLERVSWWGCLTGAPGPSRMSADQIIPYP